MCDDILFVDSEVLAKEFYEEAVARGARFNTDVTGKDFCFYPVFGVKDSMPEGYSCICVT